MSGENDNRPVPPGSGPNAGACASPCVLAGPAPEASSAAGSVVRTLAEEGIWSGPEPGHLVSPFPLPLSSREIALLVELGPALQAFYRALNRLWFGKGHDWARDWLNRGKPEWLLEVARMGHFKQHLPLLIRPDLMLGRGEMWITELDSVPGGAGHTAAIARAYAGEGFPVIGGARGIPQSFAAALREFAGRPDPVVAIAVSDESADYRPEMAWMARALRSEGLEATCVHPRELIFDEEGLWLEEDARRRRVDVLWRFYELFDLRNVPKSDLILYAARKRMVRVSPPFKPFLEEKLALALLHHPELETFWESELGGGFALLKRLVPPTWVMDPSPVPPHAEICGLRFRGRPVRDYRELAEATQSERRLVLKPSGFSPLSWGSRGVVVGHDVSREVWSEALETALRSFHSSPWILQEFREGRRVEVPYHDPRTGREGMLSGRARLCPYYYVCGDQVRLAGVLATVCSDEKKLIHGMKDAVMTVCSEGGDSSVPDG